MSGPLDASADRRFDAIIIGGGIAGLAAAWEFTRAGLRPVILEARGYLGGQIAALEVAGARIDIGAESFAPRGSAVSSMAAELGLEVVAPEGGRASLFLPPLDPSGGAPWALHPFPPGSLMGIPSDPGLPAVAAILGDEGAKRAQEDRRLPADIGRDRPDLASFVEARMGRAVVDRLVRPIVAGIHSADPADLDADRVVPGLRAATLAAGSLSAAAESILARSSGPRGDVGIRGGMGVLVEALREAILRGGGEMLTRTGARSLTRTGDGWRVEAAPVQPAAMPWAEPVPAGEPVELHARRIVLAAAPAAARRLLAALVPEAESLDSPRGAPIVRSFLAVRAPGLDEAPVGPGLLVSPEAGCPVRAKALSQLDVKWPWVAEALRAAHGPGVHLLRLSHGRPGDEDREPSAEELLEEALALTGVRIGGECVLAHRVIHWNGTLTQAAPALRERIDAVREAAEAMEGLAVTGAWVAGSGVSAVVADARSRAVRLLGE